MPGSALKDGGLVSKCEEGGRERPSDSGSDSGNGADDAGGPAELHPSMNMALGLM